MQQANKLTNVSLFTAPSNKSMREMRVNVFKYSFALWLMIFVGACNKNIQIMHQTHQSKPSVLLVLAHPDDETMIGGYLLELKRLGIPVHAIYATSGEGGKLQVQDLNGKWKTQNIAPSQLKEIREKELRVASQFYGIDTIQLLHEHDKPLRDNSGLPIRDGHSFIQKNIWNQQAIKDAIIDAVKLHQPHFIITMSLESLNHAHHKSVRLFLDDLNLQEKFNFIAGIYAFSETWWVNVHENDEKKMPKMLLNRKALLPDSEKNYGILSNEIASNYQSQSSGHTEPLLHSEELYEVSGSLHAFYNFLCKQHNCNNRITYIDQDMHP